MSFEQKLMCIIELKRRNQLKPICYTYHPEVFEIALNSKLQKQLKNHRRDNQRMVESVKIFKVERVEGPKMTERGGVVNSEFMKAFENYQDEDFLSLSVKDFVDLSYQANLVHINNLNLMHERMIEDQKQRQSL